MKNITGYTSLIIGENKVVCPSCNKNQTQRENIQEQINFLSENPGNKIEIRRLNKRLEELGGKINDFN